MMDSMMAWRIRRRIVNPEAEEDGSEYVIGHSQHCCRYFIDEAWSYLQKAYETVRHFVLSAVWRGNRPLIRMAIISFSITDARWLVHLHRPKVGNEAKCLLQRNKLKQHARRGFKVILFILPKLKCAIVRRDFIALARTDTPTSPIRLWLKSNQVSGSDSTAFANAVAPWSPMRFTPKTKCLRLAW